MTQLTPEQMMAQFLDNTAPPERYTELGIFKFAKYFFPEYFTSEFAILHYDMIQLLFALYDEKRTRRMERQAYFLVHREAAKSTTGSFLLPMYLLMMKGFSPYYLCDGKPTKMKQIKEDFIVVCSETASQAERFVTDIRSELEMNKLLIQFFGSKNPNYLDIELEGNQVWRKNCFQTTDRTIVLGMGAGQRVRGIKINGKRPSLVIVDDMYSKQNTKTEQTRENIAYWFFSELSNSCDSINGKMLWLGTMVHAETVISKMRKSEFWFGIERPIISQDELEKALLYCSKSEGSVMTIPSKAECAEYQKEFTTLSWGHRHDLYYILSLYKTAYDNKDLNSFYQEYMNQVMAPELQQISRDNFYETKLEIKMDSGYQTIEFVKDGVMWKGDVCLSIGVDPAASLKAGSDDTVLCVAGYCRVFPVIEGLDALSSAQSVGMGKIFPIIAHIEGGQYTIHDFNNAKGIVERLIWICRRYKIDNINIEANGQQMQIINEVRRSFIEQGVYIPITEEFSNTDKKEKISSTILPIIQRYEQIICQASPFVGKLYMQLLTLSVGDHDDYPDSYHIANKATRIPPFRSYWNPIAFKDTSKEDIVQVKDAWLFV